MPEYQKRHIAVSPEERRWFEEAKKRYEEQYGSTDWGGFLATAVGLGLAGLGIYSLAKVMQRSDKSAKVSCPECGAEFLLALPTGFREHPLVIEADCPECGIELVVDLVTNSGGRERRRAAK